MCHERLVLNEWLLHDLGGDNGAHEQQCALHLLRTIRERSDSIAVQRPSPWMQKAYALMRNSQPNIRLCSRFLHLKILRDPQICVLVEPPAVAPAAADPLPQVPPDDAYLVWTYRASAATRLVTTDTELLAALRQIPDISAWTKEECLRHYSIARPHAQGY